jgi:hypothetical protein
MEKKGVGQRLMNGRMCRRKSRPEEGCSTKIMTYSFSVKHVQFLMISFINSKFV